MRMLILLALALTGCTFGMAQLSPEQLKEIARDKNAGVSCFDGTYAGAKIKMLFVNADRGVPAGMTVKSDCEVTFDSNPTAH